MKLRIHHRTEYVYSTPVRNNSNELRLQPVHNDWQEPRFFLLSVRPPNRMRRFIDFQSNWVHHFEIEEPHERLVIDSQSAVTTRNRYAAGEPRGVDLERCEEARRDEQAYPYLLESKHVKISPAIWRAAVDTQAGRRDVFAVAHAIMERVHGGSSYVPGVTTVETSSEQFFADARGVCQDYTHLMLAMCRSLGIAARYVSGYLYDPTRREMRGTHASHAWCDVFVPGSGWYGLDPTNCRLVDDHYVVVAAGRDYSDSAPVKGTYWGGQSRTMTVTVHIEEG